MQVNSYLFQSPYPQSVQVGRPDPVVEQKQAAQEEAAKSKEKETAQQTTQSKQELSVKSSTMYQSDSSSKDTTKAINAFMDVAKDVRRSQYVNAYNS